MILWLAVAEVLANYYVDSRLSVIYLISDYYLIISIYYLSRIM